MTYKYLYQDKENRNCEGEIVAKNRNDAYLLLRKQGIRPYRVIGDDPLNWLPWAVASGFALLLAAVMVMGYLLAVRSNEAAQKPAVISSMSESEMEAFRKRAEEVVLRAPEAFRYNVWKGVNARLVERGIEPLQMPTGLSADEEFSP
jgi:hypothetical protein